MTRKLTQAEVNNTVWRACDSFRATVAATDYKDYVLTLLFVKYISDVWQDHYDKLTEKYGKDEIRIRRQMERERFVLSEHASFQFLYDNREHPRKPNGKGGFTACESVGEMINIALEEIELRNKKKLLNVFRNIDFNDETRLGDTLKRNHMLTHALDDFAKLDLRPSRIGTQDIIGDAYEYPMPRFAADAGKKAGEFYTPGEVSLLLAKLVAPQPGERISDPACGSGSLLIKCAHEVGSRDYSINGQEAKSDTWSLCKMNMFLHDINDARVEWGDTLLDPKLIEDDKLMRFEVVVANPPFSLDKWGADKADKEAKRFNRWHRGVPPKSKGDYAFISHMIETATEDTGRVGVVVPHGVLFRGGAEGRIRQALIEENLLDAVIGLPTNLFFGTGIPAAILIFRKDRGKRTNVLFVDASREFEPGKNRNRLREEVEVERIIAAYRKRKTKEKFASVATREEIAANEYNLNISRYVEAFEEEEEVDILAVQRDIENIETELRDVRRIMAKVLKELGL